MKRMGTRSERLVKQADDASPRAVAVASERRTARPENATSRFISTKAPSRDENSDFSRMGSRLAARNSAVDARLT